jgi:prolipoprotein diacylglyceryltransferase
VEVPTRCAAPTLRGRSTYTVLGFLGYAVSNVLGIVLAELWQLDLRDRVVTFLLPPLAFIAVVFAARMILREERIVFYQVATAAVGSVVLVGLLAGAHVTRCLDVAVTGVGTFLFFGRLGCFSVACCHGRPARFGVVYGAAHVRAGFWPRWSGRRLWPVQLVEAGVTAALVVVALVFGWDTPGLPTLIYAVGYGVCRFFLETRRGDATRPHAYGLSEAQLTALATLAGCAIWRPSITTLGALALVSVSAAWVALSRKRRELASPPHLRELDKLCASASDGERRESTLGLMVSCHQLPDGRNDWVMSSTHPAWSEATANRIALLLWNGHEVVAGRTPGVIHVLTP